MTMTIRVVTIALAAATAVAGVTTIALASPPATTDASSAEEVTFFARSTVPGEDAPEAIGPLRPDPGTTLTDVEWTFPEVNSQGNTCVAFIAQSDASDGWGVEVALNEAPIWGGAIWFEDADLSETSDGFDVRFQPNAPAVEPTPVRLCTSSANPPVDRSRFTTTQSETVWGPDTRACFDLRVQATQDIADSPFFFGWDAPVDLQAAAAMFQERGAHPTHVEMARQGEWFEASPVDLARGMTIRSTMTGSIRGLGSDVDSRDIHVCLVGW